jgi:hypothetical protein
MGYTSIVHGEVVITPPLTAVELRAAGLTGLTRTSSIPGDQASLRVRIEEEDRETDEGVLRVTRGVALVVAYQDEFRAGSLERDLQTLIANWADGHSFSGVLVVSGEDQGDVWRLVVEADEVVREDARLTWLDGSDAGPKTWPRP